MTAKSHWREGWLVWRLGWARLWPRWWVVLLIVALGAALVSWLGDADDSLLKQIRVPDDSNLNQTARIISYWGDLTWSVPLAVLLWGIGAVCKRARWRRLGWACLIGVLVAGAVLNVFRCSFGRPRPSAGLPDGFYGPHFKTAYHGFPSGHSTISFATAASVSGAPWLSVPCALYATTVGWSRMQLNRHHPLDVLTGAALGGFIGICFGSAVPGNYCRLRRKQKRRLPPDSSG